MILKIDNLMVDILDKTILRGYNLEIKEVLINIQGISWELIKLLTNQRMRI